MPRPQHRQFGGALFSLLKPTEEQRAMLLLVERQQAVSDHDLKELKRLATAITDELQRNSDPLRRD